MWKVLKNSPTYFIKTIKKNDDCIISVTNYKNHWVENLFKENFIKRLKKENDDLEFDNDEILYEKGINMISHPEELQTVSIVELGRYLEVWILKSFGYSLCFTLCMEECSKETMFKELTQPLLAMINELRSSETELRRLLKRKDKEIDEYKCEGGEIALRHLKTVKFDEESHIKKYTMFNKYFNDKVPEDLLPSAEENKPAIETKTNSNGVKQEPTTSKVNTDLETKSETTEIKIEPHAQEIRSQNSISNQSEHEVKPDAAIKIEPFSQDVTAQISSINMSEFEINEEPGIKIETGKQLRTEDNSSSSCDIKPKLEPVVPKKRHRRGLNI